MPKAPAEQRDAHLAVAARDRAHRLLALADKLTAGTASDAERAEVQWEVMGKDLESADSPDTVPATHLAVMLTKHARPEVEVMTDDSAWQPPGHVGNAVVTAKHAREDHAALTVQHECALLGLPRSLTECTEAVDKVRKSSRGKVAWAAGASLYLGSNADADAVRTLAVSAEKWWGRAEGKYADTRDDRPERRKG